MVSAGKSAGNIFKGWNCIIRSISNPSCSHSLIMNHVDQNLCISELHHSLLSLGVASPPHTTLTANTPSARHTQLLALFHLLSTDSSVSSFSQGDPLLAVSCFHGSYTQGIPTSLFSLLHALFIMVLSFFIFWLSCILFYVLGYSFLVYVCLHIQHFYSPSHSAFYAHKTRLFVFGICHGEYMKMFILIDMFLFSSSQRS